MTTLDNPSGFDRLRYRIYRAKRPTLLQRIARAFAAPAASMVEHLDQLANRSAS